MKFKLGRTEIAALDGNKYEEIIAIDHETPKAILLKIVKRGKEQKYWLPRSQLKFLQNSVEVPDWLYEKMVPV